MGTQRWLLPYADVVTLLFALFAYQYFMVSNQPPSLGPTPAASASLAAPKASPAAASRVVATPGVDWSVSIESQLRGALRGEDARLFQIYREERGIILVLSDSPLLFAEGSSTIAPPGNTLLRRLLPVIKNTQAHLHIEGHADSRPLVHPFLKDNWDLSLWRAASVAKGLMSLGVESDQLSLMGYADRRPVSSNQQASGRRNNRRVELIFQFDAPGNEKVDP